MVPRNTFGCMTNPPGGKFVWSARLVFFDGEPARAPSPDCHKRKAERLVLSRWRGRPYSNEYGPIDR
jgi:hypothetical protein